MSSTPLLVAASISMTSPAFNSIAQRRAIVVLPQPLTPVKRKAWLSPRFNRGTNEAIKALLPTTSSHVCGRYRVMSDILFLLSVDQAHHIATFSFWHLTPVMG